MSEKTMVPMAAMQAALDAMEAYVPIAQRENARAAALAHSIGYAYPGKGTIYGIPKIISQHERYTL